MQTFKIGKDGFKDLKRRFLIRAVPFMVIVTAIIIVYGPIRYGMDDIITFAIIIIILAVSVGLGSYRGLKKIKIHCETYSLTITENLIQREYANAPTISIYFNDIREIVKHRNNTFTIIGKEPHTIIGIPAVIENYSQLETRLQEIRPIVLKGNISVLQKYQVFAGFLTIGLLICILVVNNRIIVVLSGSLLVVWFIVRFLVASTGKNIRNTARRGTWKLLLMISAVILLVLFKLV